MSDFLVNFINDGESKTTLKSGGPKSGGPKSGGPKSGEFKTEKPKTTIQKSSIPRSPTSSDAKNFNKTDDTLYIKFTAKTGEEIISVGRFKKNSTVLFNKSVIFYGPSGSGKTTLMKDYMYIMRKVFPIVFAFVPTNCEKHDFDRLIPTPLIFEEFGLNDIKNIYNRQQAAAFIYNTANDLNILYKLFQRVADVRARQYLDRIMLLKKKCSRKIEEQYASELTLRKNKLDEVEEIFKDKLINYYKY